MDTHLGFVDLASKTINSSATIHDNSFGPFIDFPGKVPFDFTLLFEETILSILPSALFLLLVPPRILRLWRTPRKVTGSYLQTTKIVGLQICPSSKMLTIFRRCLPFSVSYKSSMWSRYLSRSSVHGPRYPLLSFPLPLPSV
jgi:hypothetical protein